MHGVNQLFKYELKTNQIKSPANEKCLEAFPDDGRLDFRPCDESAATQRWTWTDFVNETSLENWIDSGRPFEDDDMFYWDE